MKRLALFTCLFATAVAGVAYGDDDVEEQKRVLKNELSGFDISVIYLVRDQGLDGAGLFAQDPSVCTETIEKLKALGLPPTEMIFTDEKFLFRKAPERCERYAKFKALSESFEAIKEARQVDMIIRDMKPGADGTTMWSGEGTTRAQKCVDVINAVEAKGAPMDVVLRSTDPQMTAAQTRTWCEDLGKRAAALQGESAGADTEKKKAARNRYAKHGAAGDKLDLLVYYDPDGTGTTWRIAGCKATDDPKTLVKSKILIRWGVNPDGTQVLRKYTFKGNKKVKDQEKTFLTEAKAYSFCK
jgi:hypothetical protein